MKEKLLGRTEKGQSIEALLDEYAERAVWNTESIINVLLEYVGSLDDNAKFRSFLEEKLKEEE